VYNLKKLFYVIIIMLCVGFLAACATTETPVAEEPIPTIAPTPEPSPEPTPEPEPDHDTDIEPDNNEADAPLQQHVAPTGLSDDLFSFMFSLDGALFTLPFSFEELAAYGWEWDDPRSVSLRPNQRGASKRMRNEDGIFWLTTVNTSSDVVYSHESNVGTISIDRFDFDRGGTALILPGGITIGSTYDEVLAAYGEPSERRPYSNTAMTRNLVYSVGAYATVTIAIDIETDIVFSLRMENVFAREALPAFEGDMPDAVLSYVAPTTLGDDWRDFVVRFDGDLYRLPAPVAAFIANGWILESDPSEMVNAQSSRVGVSLRKGNQVMRTTVHNYDNSAQPISHSFVTVIEFSHHAAVLPIELPGGITENSTEEEILAIFGGPSDAGDSATFHSITFGRIWQDVRFSFVTETGEIHSIRIEHSPRDLN